jgi:hypothetical protein
MKYISVDILRRGDYVGSGEAMLGLLQGPSLTCQPEVAQHGIAGGIQQTSTTDWLP